MIESSVVASISVYPAVLTVVWCGDVEKEGGPREKPLVLYGLAMSSGEMGTVKALRRRTIRS